MYSPNTDKKHRKVLSLKTLFSESFRPVISGLVLCVFLAAPFLDAKEKAGPGKPAPAAHDSSAAPISSIRVKGKPKTSVLATLAKISYQDAMAAALQAVPGKIVYGELEVEEGNLKFDFEIVTAANKVMDVSIDAGNGKVLDIDDSDND